LSTSQIRFLCAYLLLAYDVKCHFQLDNLIVSASKTMHSKKEKESSMADPRTHVLPTNSWQMTWMFRVWRSCVNREDRWQNTQWCNRSAERRR